MKYFDRNTWFWMFMGILFFFPFIGSVHLFDWDEINFAELAREMTVTGDYLQLQLGYLPFTEKPPLFFWLQALSMEVFGVGEFAARLPNALLGIIVLPFLYICGKFLVDRRFGYLWALSWFGSILPFMYFKSGIIDPLFNFFIFNGLFFLIHYIWKKKSLQGINFSRKANTYLWLAGISIGLGVLTKGPVAYLLVFLCLVVYWVSIRFRAFLNFKFFLAFSFIALGVFLLWFAVEFTVNGPDFLVEFTVRQWALLTTGDAGHSGFAGYHFVVLILGCFPASILALHSFRLKRDIPEHLLDFQKWMLILLAVVVILFSLVGTKIVHYSSMAYYPISFLSALALWQIIEKQARFKLWNSTLLVLIGFILISASTGLVYLGLHPDALMPLLAKDAFANANMQAAVNWSFWDYTPAIFYALVLVVSAFFYKRNRARAFKTLFLGTGIWTMLALIFFIGKVERISQNANVEFFEAYASENAYFISYDFKSYVPEFYGALQPPVHPKSRNKKWLFTGAVDKDVYITCRINRKEKLELEIIDATFLYAKNGFYFYKRNKQG